MEMRGRSWIVSVGVVVLATVVATGCGETPANLEAPSSRADVAGEYVLREVDGLPMPVVRESARGIDFTCDTHVLDGSLTLDRTGRFDLTVAFRGVCTNGTTREWGRDDHGEFEFQGRHLVFEQDPSSDWYRAITSATPALDASSLTAFTSIGSAAVFVRR